MTTDHSLSFILQSFIYAYGGFILLYFAKSMENRWGNNGNSDILLLGAPKSLQIMTAAMKLKDTYSFEEKL